MRSKRPDSKQQGTQPAAAGWLRKYWHLVVIVLGIGLTALLIWGTQDNAKPNAPTTPGSPALPMSGSYNNGLASSAGFPQKPADRVATLKEQVELSENTLCSYISSSKYPHESRPIAEHPDQVYPNQPVEDMRAMHTADGKADSKVMLKTSQSHVYVASGESVVFSVKAVDPDGKTLPMFVTRAISSAVSDRGSRIGTLVNLQFNDDGRNGDAAANDGVYTGVLTPSANELASFNGTIRTEVKYNVGDRSGSVFFDIIYTPELPAVWSGPVREAMEEGSLNFYLKADVRKAGRYVVTGRVDDAKGKPFALVNFNDVLPAGPNEIRLQVFGKLITDQKPAFPLVLRDVDAYLLKEDVSPDRALMPRLIGNIHTSKNYSSGGFSNTEWHSEERSRYLTEFTKDVNVARSALAKADSTQSDAKFSENDCKNRGVK